MVAAYGIAHEVNGKTHGETSDAANSETKGKTNGRATCTLLVPLMAS